MRPEDLLQIFAPGGHNFIQKLFQILGIGHHAVDMHDIQFLGLSGGIAVSSVFDKIKRVSGLIKIPGQLMVFPIEFAEPRHDRDTCLRLRGRRMVVMDPCTVKAAKKTVLDVCLSPCFTRPLHRRQKIIFPQKSKRQCRHRLLPLS